MKLAPARTALLAVCLTACGTTSHSYNVSAAPGGETPACTTLITKTPTKLAGRTRKTSGPEGTAVWGDGDVILRCGDISNVPPSAPCSTMNGVAWIVNEHKSEHGDRTLLSYARTPAVEITLSNRLKNQSAILRYLSTTMPALPEPPKCPNGN
ncbi:DUF3515 family protein [Actinomadura atramentaria]|uniref:DUF3515 family protein n=1 Tax=Actinomadura atramentaria TaxID=1990 RepID=UPI000A04AD62|nr:DUF3515 family protein [Actinomadura atramentaria]